ncbi:MAG: hypothetical protein SFZ24_11865 [Planctomycetota bacterium]|nr:hypothetical protein [Planctomycetota bacterium]
MSKGNQSGIEGIGDGGGPLSGPPTGGGGGGTGQPATSDQAAAALSAIEPLEGPEALATASARAEALAARVAELERTLAETREALDSAERRHRIDLALIEAQTVDLESARLLTEMTVSAMPEPDVERAVAELRARKPFLFRQSRRHPGAAVVASAREPGPDAVERAADEAARTGDRGALLRYLRARRGAP